MANQAIALQARAPQQSNILGGALQQGAQMINMMSQQRAAERQAAVAQQEMEIARAAEARAAAKEGRDIERFAVDQDALLYAKYRNMAPAVIASDSPEVYAQWLGMLNEESPERAQMIARAMPPEQFNKDTFTLMMGTMDQNFEARYGKAITKELITPEGGVLGANISGIPGATYAVPVPDISRPRAGAPAQTPGAAAPRTAAPAQNPMSAPRATAPATDAQIDEAARAIIGGAGIQDGPLRGLSMEDFDRATERANQMTAGGGRMRPISMTTGAQMGGQPDMTAVVQDMMSSGQISQSNLQLMREMAGPDKDAQLAQILKANNIQIVPDDQPGMRSAVFRPGQDVAPQMQQAQFNPNDYEPVRVKSPMQSPSQAPGAAGAVSGATTAASEGVRVRTQPKIVAGEERVKRVEKLRGELPLARSETQTLIDNLDRRIDAIDRFLRNPYRSSIIGAIEGRIPRMLQTPTRADVQALYDTIVSNTVLNKLIEDRQATETGASPQGIVSDRDLAVAAQASNSLTQTGTERQQEIEMQRLRNILYQTRQRALEKYNTVYREVLSEAPDLRLQVPSIAPKYQSKPTKVQPQRGGISPDVAKKYGL